MKYDMLPYKTIDRLWNAFQGHSGCVNEKYKAFKREDSYCYSDRDRFVAKFFKKYVGKCIAFADFGDGSDLFRLIGTGRIASRRESWDFALHSVKIKHCPMCGRKLEF